MKHKELIALTTGISINLHFVDLLHELTPALSLELSVLNLLLTEAYHCLHVVLDLLMLECRDCNVMEVNDKIVLNYFIVLYVFLTL